MKNSKVKILKRACYTVNLSMSAVAILSPLLFLTFHSMYGISYSALGFLVTLNFTVQLGVDLWLSFFSDRLNLVRLVRLTPVLTAAGLLVYAMAPVLFPGRIYLGLAAGTLLFAASGGLAEVLISPVIAALPSDNPDRDMSRLHSVYAWGVVGVVAVGTVFLQIFGRKNWSYLALLWMVLPVLSAVLFALSEVPELRIKEQAEKSPNLLKEGGFWACFLCIFLGGAAENIMTQWSSSYLEMAVGLPKMWGDLLGVAMFGAALGLGRSLYAKYGKNIHGVLLVSAGAAVVCYLTAALSQIPLVGLAACVLTGLCTAMLWPGSLIVGAEKFPAGGVMLYALMAAGGDLGGAIGPQMVGILVDAAGKDKTVLNYAAQGGLGIEQASMKMGLLFAVIFPVVLTAVYAVLYKKEKTKRRKR